MATYINSLPLNTVLIGITADAAQRHLSKNANVWTSVLGFDLTGLDMYGKLMFVSQIGQADMSVSHKVSQGGNNLKMTVHMTGIL
jgi:hypothetical protein